MGLLDDAIREHLDLKRRRGGDPAEIERAEHEALGPVRRDPFAHSSDDFDEIAVPDDGPRAYDHEEDPHGDEGYEEYAVEEEWEDDYEEPFGAEEPTARPPYPAEAGEGDETMQYDVEEALASESSQGKRGPDWVEQSEQWVEPAQPPIAEPGATEAHAESAYSEPGEPGYDESAPYDEADALPHEPRGEGPAKPEEDVLEETPEFQQDASEQDRRWFERRPRRGADFDG